MDNNSTEVETVIHSDNDFATVAFLRVKNAELKSKEALIKTLDVPVPPLLEEDFRAVHDTIVQSQESASVGEPLKPAGQTEVVEPIDRDVQIQKFDSWMSVANIERKLGNPMVEISIEDEVTVCFLILKGQFQPPCLFCSLTHPKSTSTSILLILLTARLSTSCYHQ
jgi:diphthine-ammonia ligase